MNVSTPGGHSNGLKIHFLFLFSLVLCAGAAEPDRLLADFESADYGDWKTTGDAFGAGPASGTLPGQMPVSGFKGQGLVNSFRGGDKSTGTLTSTEFKIDRRFLNFLIGGGGHDGKTCLNLLVDGKVVRTATGPNTESGGSEKLEPATWSLAEFSGRTARLQMIDHATGGWGHINVDQIALSDTAQAEPQIPVAISTARLYDETYRPQFHFTARSNWLNDPNGLVFYQGEYHLFFQHNPLGIGWGNMTWGHAISPDLVHWTQLPNALERDALGDMWSGSAVVDWHNTAGLQRGDEKTLVAIYTAAGGQSALSKGQPFTQCLAYSQDRGRTWTKFAGNPVLKNVDGDNRDPKVFWHEPTRRWIMALWVPIKDAKKKDAAGKAPTIHTIQFFNSANLTEWSYLSRTEGLFECPDLFALPVDGDAKNTRWVLFGASGEYVIGRFDGKEFTKESSKLTGDWGKNFYAAQTYSDIPASVRRILIGWMREGKYPRMPFNQQMTFPVELTLRTTPDGLRLHKEPISEIAALRRKTHEWSQVSVNPGENPLAQLAGDLFEIEAEFEPAEATAIGFLVRGSKVSYHVADKKLSALGQSAALPTLNGRVKLRLLVDRTSLEIFCNDGRVTMSSCFLPRPDNRGMAFFTEGGAGKIISLRVHELKSAWPGVD